MAKKCGSKKCGTKKAAKKTAKKVVKAAAPALRPLDDRIVVKRAEAEEKSAGGIILVDSAKEKPSEGTVVAVGAGKLLDNGTRATPDVEVGDTVLFGLYSGTEVKVSGEAFLIMKESEILAKL